MQQNATGASGQLLPRYRQPLTFGAVLDETFQIYRKEWLRLIGILALLIVPTTVLMGALGAFTVFSLASNPGVLTSRDPADVLQFMGSAAAAGAVLGLLFGLATVIAGAAAVACTDRVMRGQEPAVWSSYGRALGRIGGVFLGMLALIVAYVVLVVLSSVAVLLWVLPGLFGLTPLVALVVWAANPGARQGWLKWLIILTTPFGLAIYFGIKWALWLQPIVLEGRGPVEAIQRSQALMAGNWFRSAGVLLVIGLITGILQALPGGILSILVGGAVGLQGGADQGYLAMNVVSNAANFIAYPLFGGLAFITTTLLFVDLRNRHEGTDLEERLSELESSSFAAQ